MLVGMASEINKNYTYKCVDRSRHNGIKGVISWLPDFLNCMHLIFLCCPSLTFVFVLHVFCFSINKTITGIKGAKAKSAH